MSRRSAPSDAEKMFTDFNGKPPRRVGNFKPSFKIPRHVRLLGDSLNILYRSDKVDPATGKQPRGTVDYIHDHDPGVKTYAPDEGGDHETPGWLRDTTSFVLLGKCLGIDYRDEDGEDVEIGAINPLPELYCTPCGRALLVITGKKLLEAIIWGGSLTVEDRGIVG